MQTKFEMVAKTFRGLEDVLRDELIALGAENVQMGLRMVSFEGDNAMLYKANLCLHTALRVLKPIYKFTAADTDELYDTVRDFEWDTILSPDKTFSIDTTANSEEFSHSRYATYRVKDGIADYFFDKYGRRPSIRLDGADVQLNVHIADKRVTISMDSSGEPLNRRGYRVASVEAPVNEVLAAGIIMKTGWRGDTDFVDPMCGSGTFLIEAALIAANINPGIYRKHFAFETWEDFDRDLFEEIYNDDSQEREFAHKIYGSDILQASVAATRRNVAEARLDSMIEVSCHPFEECQNPPADGILVTNPPYGQRLRPDDIAALYHRLGTTLKQTFKGYHAWILGYNDDNFREIGLKPSVTFPILNGKLECELREYVIFEGKYSDFREDGGSVRNEKFNRDVKPKVRRMTDKEWDQETSRFGAPKHDRRRDDRRRDDKKGYKVTGRKPRIKPTDADHVSKGPYMRPRKKRD